MKRFLSVILAGVVFTACSNSSNGGQPPVDCGGGARCLPKQVVLNSKPGTGKVLVIGDSLAHGYGSVSDEFIPSECIDKNFPSTMVVNMAVDGQTTQQLKANIAPMLQLQPKVVFVSTGGNDAFAEYAQPGSYPNDQTLQEGGEIFKTFQDAGAMVIYLALNPPFAAQIPAAERLPLLANVGLQNGVLLVDGMRDLWENPLLMADEYHPNDDGYKIMCDRIVEAMKDHYP